MYQWKDSLEWNLVPNLTQEFNDYVSNILTVFLDLNQNFSSALSWKHDKMLAQTIRLKFPVRIFEISMYQIEQYFPLWWIRTPKGNENQVQDGGDFEIADSDLIEPSQELGQLVRRTDEPKHACH